MAHLDHHREVFTTLASVRTPRLMRAIAAILIVGVSAVSAFMALTPWVQTTAGAGVVTALNPNDRQQQINALVPGRIDEWYVRDGSVVKAGDPIVRIVDYDPRLIERLEAERAQVLAKREASAAALGTAEIDLRRMQDLFNKGLAARREFEQAQIAVQDLRGRLAEVEAELTRVDVNLSRQSVQIVTAPRDGVIMHKSNWNGEKFDVGSQVWRGQTVAEIPDPATLAVRAQLPERDLQRVKEGVRARIVVEGGGGSAYHGKVAGVGRAVRSKSQVQPVPVLDLEIRLDDAKARLRPGQAVRVELTVPDIAGGAK